MPVKGCLNQAINLTKTKDTGDRFRSYVLGVMSPARFLCATPVKGCLNQAINLAKTKIPATGFDPVT